MKPAEPEERLTDEEIEAILERENAGLPPEAEAPAAPEVHLVRREPNEGRFGKWVVWLTIAFIVMGVIQTMR